MDLATKEGLTQLRSVRLSPFEVDKLQLLALEGGEASWYPERAPLALNQMFQAMVPPRDGAPLGLVEFLDVTSRRRIQLSIAEVARVVSRHGSRVFIRLTDDGRKIAERLDAMSAKSRIVSASAT